jgi:hypothetical protein
MKELSMHILDIAQNSIRGEGQHILIHIVESKEDNLFSMTIEDDGKGIAPEVLATIRDPFTTSRKLRRVGLGIPLLQDTCRLCEGSLEITSEVGIGTKVIATMKLEHIDRPPLGDMATTMAGFISSHEDRDIHYIHECNHNKFEVSTLELKEALGDVSLAETDVYIWLRNYIHQELEEMSC